MIDISTMGKGVLESHINGKIHKLKMGIGSVTGGIKSFFKPKPSTSQSQDVGLDSREGFPY